MNAFGDHSGNNSLNILNSSSILNSHNNSNNSNNNNNTTNDGSARSTPLSATSKQAFLNFPQLSPSLQNSGGLIPTPVLANLPSSGSINGLNNNTSLPSLITKKSSSNKINGSFNNNNNKNNNSNNNNNNNSTNNNSTNNNNNNNSAINSNGKNMMNNPPLSAMTRFNTFNDQTPLTGLPSKYMGDMFPSPSFLHSNDWFSTGQTPIVSSNPYQLPLPNTNMQAGMQLPQPQGSSLK
ncbi:unnamed protein product [[Candida] boidinii]|nr:unnamed protein product [[Candida] boidinii]